MAPSYKSSVHFLVPSSSSKPLATSIHYYSHIRYPIGHIKGMAYVGTFGNTLNGSKVKFRQFDVFCKQKSFLFLLLHRAYWYNTDSLTRSHPDRSSGHTYKPTVMTYRRILYKQTKKLHQRNPIW